MPAAGASLLILNEDCIPESRATVVGLYVYVAGIGNLGSLSPAGAEASHEAHRTWYCQVSLDAVRTSWGFSLKTRFLAKN